MHCVTDHVKSKRFSVVFDGLSSHFTVVFS